ncbi:MAG TPA: hypothetical protein VKU89_00960 [Solirubrobacteraceae bacterium]|nr:hypothetical protein [Solirubrobacteraceae bacterium]
MSNPEGFFVPGEGGKLVPVKCGACGREGPGNWARAPEVRMAGALDPDKGVNLSPMVCTTCGHVMLQLAPPHGNPQEN